jgi:hypothetical protein
MIKPPRSKHTGIGPGDMMCEACANRPDRKERGWTDMGGDYTEGERGVLARIIHEHFCCNCGFAFLAGEAIVPVMLKV